MVRWSEETAPAADAAQRRRPAFRRVLDEIGELREAGFGAVRALVAVTVVTAVIVLALGYAGERSETGVVVKAPTFVSVPVAVLPPPAPSPDPAPDNRTVFEPRDWYLRQTPDFEQLFAAGRGGDALCAAFAASGYRQAVWAESAIFRGEWECSSPEGGPEGGEGVFIVVRGRAREAAGSVMLKLNAQTPDAQSPFRAEARTVLDRFLQAAGVPLDPEIAERFAEWKPGTFRHGFQTLRLVRQHGREAPNVVHFAIAPNLPRPVEGACGPDCFPLLAGSRPDEKKTADARTD